MLYARLSRLLDDLATARLAGADGRLMRRLAKVDLLILDDWAMTDLTAQQRRDVMEIVDDRYDRRSIILATQVPVDRWHDMIGDPTYADAILDRIVHNATRVELQGEPLRNRCHGRPPINPLQQQQGQPYSATQVRRRIPTAPRGAQWV